MDNNEKAEKLFDSLEKAEQEKYTKVYTILKNNTTLGFSLLEKTLSTSSVDMQQLLLIVAREFFKQLPPKNKTRYYNLVFSKVANKTKSIGNIYRRKQSNN